MNPRISIIIPAFNRRHLIADALLSIRQQTLKPHEVIVVDDGSEDDLQSYLMQCFPEVNYIWQENAGPSSARNNGVSHATGDWVYFLDSDDMLSPNALELFSAQASGLPDQVVIFARAENVKGSERSDYINDPELIDQLNDMPTGPVVIFDTLLRANVIPMGAVMMTRKLAQQAPFDSTLQVSEDYCLWLNLANSGFRFVYVNAVVLNRRMHEGNLISQKIAAMEATLKVLARYIGRPVALKRMHAIHYDLGSAYFRQMRWGKAYCHLSQAEGRGLVLALKRMVAGAMAV
jgi:glycosyltransferase involved in cell wall biosynthesis